MLKLTEVDMNTIKLALLDAMEYSREKQQSVSDLTTNKAIYTELYNRLFMPEVKGK